MRLLSLLQNEKQIAVDKSKYRRSADHQQHHSHRQHDGSLEPTATKRPRRYRKQTQKNIHIQRFSSVDWGTSFRNISSQRQLQPQKSVRFDDMDDYDEDITEGNKRSSCCLVFTLTLLTIAVAAAVSFIAFPSNTATLYWKDMGSNDDTAQHQQGREQEMLELAERITVACGDLSTSSCLKLCSQHMCCVEQDDEYSCKSDVTKDCAVYAGCVVLIDDE